VRTIASNVVSIAIARGGPLGSRVLLLLAIARFSSSDALAHTSYAIAIAEAVRIVADGGMEMWALREIAQAKGPQEQARSTAAMAVIKIVYGLIGGAVAALVTWFSSDAGVALALLSGAFVLAGELFAIGLIHHISRSTPHRLVPVSLLAAAVIMAAGIFGLAQGLDATWAVGIAAGVELLAAVYVLVSPGVSEVLAVTPGIGARSLQAIRQSLPTTAYSAVVALYSRLDAIALNAFSAAALATYSVAFRATQPFAFVFGAVALAIYASQTREINRTPEQARAALRKALLTVFLSAAAAAVLTYIVCAWLIANVIPAYAESLGTLRILCAVMPLVALNNVSMYALAGQGRFGALLGLVAANLVAMSASLIVLVPGHAAEGAAYSFLASQLLCSALLFVLHARARLERVPA
jgi:O-antigen/teichoic acid export membrane protein